MSQRIFNQDGVAVHPPQATPATAATKLTPKQKVMDALRKTGHVSENVLEAVAEVAVRTLFGFGGA